MKTSTKSDTGSKKSNSTIDSTFDIDELLALARIDLEKGSLEQALHKIKQIIAEPDAPSEALSLAGRLYAQIGLWAKAKPLFERYLAKNPQAVTEAFQLGMVHFDGGQLDEALQIWLGLIQKHPTHPPALFYSALGLAQQGKTPDARTKLDVLLKSAAPDNLYFSRAKELLQAIDARQAINPALAQSIQNGQPKGEMPVVPKDAYKTEH